MPAPSLFALELQSARPTAVRRFRALLLRHGGSVTGVAEELGVRAATIHEWAQRAPAVRQALDELGMGRAGAGRNAAKLRGSGGTEKKIKKAT